MLTIRFMALILSVLVSSTVFAQETSVTATIVGEVVNMNIHMNRGEVTGYMIVIEKGGIKYWTDMTQTLAVSQLNKPLPNESSLEPLIMHKRVKVFLTNLYAEHTKIPT